MAEPRFLDVEDILYIHRREIERTGGDTSLRDASALPAIVAAPQASHGGEYLMDLFNMAAAYVVTIAFRHPFLDGNKRAGAVNDTVRLHYTENPGAFLGLGSGLAPTTRVVLFVMCVGILLACLVVYLFAAKQPGLAETTAASLVVAGGVGNLLDRVALGFVRDFASIGIGPVRSGVFNIADAAITAGVCLLLWHLLSNRQGRGEGRLTAR